MTVTLRARLFRFVSRPSALAIGALAVTLFSSGVARTAPQAATQAAKPADQADAATLVAHGEYLANRVAMCVQCHSPRDAHGNVLLTQKFRGAPIPVTSPWPEREFAFRAPSIAGLPGFTDEQIIALLTEGKAIDRDPPRPPMPPFRMTRQDAQAIVAYLRSL
ncbi:MAG TPA: c-type cytochrome [Vicinamibacterales bacterium]|nr:c-type cytochrome [Vicinamibacterales bacterium]